MKRTTILLISISLIVGSFACAQDEDKEMQEQLDQATEAAKKMGVKMPDIQKLLDENAKEEASEKAAENEKQKDLVAKHTGPVTLPAWTPQVPQFKSVAPPAIKMIDGKATIVATGTSSLTPDALADAWDAFKNPKFSHERGGSDINHSVDLYVSFRNGEDGSEVKMEAERKAGAKITRVTLSSPLTENPLNESAGEAPSAPTATKVNDAANAAPTPDAAPSHVASDVSSGSAKGSLTFDGATAELKFASGFVDQKDERKPVVLLVSDQKLPTEKWKSEFDIMLDHTKWNGLTFFLDKEGTIFRTDVHMNGRQTSVSGLFDVKIDSPASKDLAGTAKASESEKETKLDVAFHAAIK